MSTHQPSDAVAGIASNLARLRASRLKLRAEIALMDVQIRQAEEAEAMASMERLIRAVSQGFGVTMADIVGRSRANRYVFARHAFCHLARRRLGQSSVRIGRYLGRDHGTVLHDSQVAMALIQTMPGYARTIEEIEKEIE